MAANIEQRPFDSNLKQAIVKVGKGRGFIVEGRDERRMFGRRTFQRNRFVLTAAHWLPEPAPAHFKDSWECTYEKLLGALDKDNATACCPNSGSL